MKRITVTIKDGAAKVETSGFTGSECLRETIELEKALGDTTQREMTAESRQAQEVQRATVKH